MYFRVVVLLSFYMECGFSFYFILFMLYAIVNVMILCNVRSNTDYVYHLVTPSAACPLNRRLCSLEKYKRECGDCTRHVGLEILDSKGTGRCC